MTDGEERGRRRRIGKKGRGRQREGRKVEMWEADGWTKAEAWRAAARFK